MLTRKQWLDCNLLLVLLWALDFTTKSFVAAEGPFHMGRVHLVINHNYGLVTGIFNTYPELLSIFVSVLSIFILISYFSILYFVPNHSSRTRIGLTFIMSGILGNMTDRALNGYVIDFVNFSLPPLSGMYFNLADFIQWPGYIILFKAIIFDQELIPKDSEQRKHIWVNRPFQMKFFLILFVTVFFLSVLFLLFFNIFFRLLLQRHLDLSVPQFNQLLFMFHLIFVSIFFSFIFILFFISKYFSHRIAGPIFALECFLKQLGQGQDAELRLRKGDDFKHLADVARNLKENWKK